MPSFVSVNSIHLGSMLALICPMLTQLVKVMHDKISLLIDYFGIHLDEHYSHVDNAFDY